MNIYFTHDLLEAVRKAKPKSKILQAEHSYGGKDIDTKFIDHEDFELIRKVARKPAFVALIESKRVLKKLDAVEALKKTGPHGVRITKLEVMAEILRDVMAKTPHKWIFLGKNSYGVMLPYFLSEVEYHPPERERGGYRAAYTEVTLSAVRRGAADSETLNFRKEDMGGTIEELLVKRDAFIETETLVKEYEADLAKYKEECPKTGKQFLAVGTGSASDDGKWHRDVVHLERDGNAAKVVMDDQLNQGTSSGFVQSKFWNDLHEEDEEADDTSDVFGLPVHPIVKVFNLGTHEYLTTHISNITEYKYDPAMAAKLVLPPDHVELIDALTGNAIRKIDDIIKGKAVGVIVLCSGEPGTGKTLTAEVYSEVAKMPLYMVQCSQLGTDEAKLEERLAEVLDRAKRWKAILLIDEADVYIHERGNDIQQNAIVGVFLRLLEYFNGIMFLTTNRDTVIDDAILSRATAHVRYKVSDAVDERTRLWKVLAQQYGADELAIKEVLAVFPKITGRSVRQLLKLARIMADHRGKKLNVEMLKWAAKFHDFSENEEAKL